ncbi:hypothetical protein FB381_0326 [Nocardioides albertanoniae]|uniref:Uncharacterized protein n=1 Tax=Nocardioides albertanoniae TaxID=1175486 RepID=A0A543A1L5_9ACTN|nr:hypothetical protein [Nocardioides albertanoniae]TQL66464.1 hypothetical protein FB381_0326 [Nocardioides albertanoniae]
MIRKLVCAAAAGVAAAALWVTPWASSPATAAPLLQLSGAIFTSDVSGAPVNLNHYAAKEDVYLNGGPGTNAPVDAAGLPAGIYAFQVTDPSGKTLLSTDPVACRRVEVDDSGRFASVASSGACAHATGTDAEDGGITVQLFPFLDTPNNGGEYKAWLTPYDALDPTAPGNRHGFVPADSKTDNFKVRARAIVEIDTRFSRDGGPFMDGLAAEWTDTLGAHNVKYSEYNPAVLAFHEAHVEAAEAGLHTITVTDQPGCEIDDVHHDGQTFFPGATGSVTVPVEVKKHMKGDHTYWVDVHCV